MTEKQENYKNKILAEYAETFQKRDARAKRMKKDLPENCKILKKVLETEWTDNNVQELFFIYRHDDTFSVEDCNRLMALNGYSFRA